MIDCLLIGYNDVDFADYVKRLEAMGTDSGAYAAINLAFIEQQGRPYRCLDVLDHFSGYAARHHRPMSNTDFLWPVITYLGTYLARRGFSFDYVNLFHLEKGKLAEKLRGGDVCTVAVTTTLYVSVEPILEIVSFVRRHDRGAKIIVGGPYVLNQARMFDDDALHSLFEYIGADVYVISPEGESTLVRLLRALKDGSSLAAVDNIAYRRGSRFVRTGVSEEVNPLAENMVDYRLFPGEDLGELVNVRTAKSCPFRCAFCGFPQRAGRFACLPVELVEQELNALGDLGTVSTLTFIDDSINVPLPRMKDVLRMMIRNRYGFRWNSYLRSDYADEECIALMKESGCEGVFLGVESGSVAVLENMNKKARPEHHLQAISWLRQHEILMQANFIVGFPGETRETVQETLALIEEARPDFFAAQLWYCDPTTPIWNRREQFGLRGAAFNWSHQTMDFATAADLVNRFLLAVDGSIWLPQYGFEFWSLFYLLRKGMTLPQLKTFLKCFQAALRQKLIDPRQREVGGPLLESLRASCQFDAPSSPDMRPVDVLSGSGYLQAERYWSEQFGNVPAANLDALRDGQPGADDRRDSVPCVVDERKIDALARRSSTDRNVVLLAAFSVLLSRCSARQDTLILAALDGQEGPLAVPLRLRAGWDASFREHLEQVRAKIASGERHASCALHVLTNPVRMGLHHGSCPKFDAGYAVVLPGRPQNAGPLEQALAGYPQVLANLDLVLQAHSGQGHLQVALCYAARAFQAQTVERLAGYLRAILDAASDDPGVLLGDVAVDKPDRPPDRPGEADRQEVFDF